MNSRGTETPWRWSREVRYTFTEAAWACHEGDGWHPWEAGYPLGRTDARRTFLAGVCTRGAEVLELL
ncbi:hypothetical protein OHU17_00510 [Streptomyces goshikiensis]|uniref:Uncharacterized protein n=1 Tax=Streptomyces goshikiensis TaxID=1942 RepID=A0ABZ1RE66_9ACTN|nr:hypothetical protein [Streptomyces goshikiensis]